MANVLAAVAKILISSLVSLFEALLGVSQYDMCVAVQSINFVFGFGILDNFARTFAQRNYFQRLKHSLTKFEHSPVQ